MFIFNNLY